MEIIIIFLYAVAFLSPISAVVPDEGRVISECLESYGGLTEENARRLIRFKEWSANYEEIPCFSQCYLKKMFGLFNELSGFNAEKVIKQFGQVLYNACRHRMVPLPNSCEVAYHGFHCLVNLEDDPFVLIESMQNVSVQAKSAMKDCLHRFDRYEWERMKDYKKNPVREPISCFTECFIERLHVYDRQKRQWNIPALRTQLGVPKVGVNIKHCMAIRRTRNSCVWTYQEFTCFGLASIQEV